MDDSVIKKRKEKAMEAKYVVKPLFPREIFLDLTSFCNHACVFCSNHLLKHKVTMKKDMVCKVLKEAYECGIRDIGMYATGESFMVKELAEYIKEAKKIGYEYIFITTNGALVDEKRGKAVLDAGLDSLKFSISAGTREMYKKIQGKDDFEKVIANLKWVYKYREQSGLKYRIYVTMVYTKVTEPEVETLKNLVMPYCDEWDPHPINNQCGKMFENNELGKIDANNPRGRGFRERCFQPFKSFTVTPEGYMTACVLDYSKDLVIADLNKTSMKEAWASETYKKFRERHINKDLKGMICHNCMNNKNEKVEPLTPKYADPFK